MTVNQVQEPALEWQTIKDFTASTTVSEKVWRVVHPVIFLSAAWGLYTLVGGKKQPISTVLACYLPIVLAVRKIVSTLLGYAVYPAIVVAWYYKNDVKEMDEEGKVNLRNNGFYFREISLHKSGTTYVGMVIGYPPIIGNRKWAIHALGNNQPLETIIYEAAYKNWKNGCNTLLINGPGVSKSGGFPTRYQLGAGFEAGLQFLEKEVKATHIIFKGFSLGNGMMSEAVLNHTFLKNVRYLGVSDRTFGRLSAIAAYLYGVIATVVFYSTGTELDGISAAKKLSDLEIKQIIIQHSGKDGSNDGIIPHPVSLASAIRNLDQKVVLESPNILHIGSLPEQIEKNLDEHVKRFLALPEFG